MIFINQIIITSQKVYVLDLAPSKLVATKIKERHVSASVWLLVVVAVIQRLAGETTVYNADDLI